MADDDPSKRCFHALFTDLLGPEGTMGAITPDLLARLFSDDKKAGRPTPNRKHATNGLVSSGKVDDESGDDDGTNSEISNDDDDDDDHSVDEEDECDEEAAYNVD